MAAPLSPGRPQPEPHVLNTCPHLSRPLALIGMLISASMAFANPVSTGVIAAYTLVTSATESPSGLIARAVLTEGATCPILKVTLPQGEKNLRTWIRPHPANTLSAFNPVRVCESIIPKNVTHARIGSHVLPVHPKKGIRNIAVLGDTGCSITEQWGAQDCNQPDAWPLSKITQQIANEKPDLVVLLGDFFYRESACPLTQQAACGSSPPPLLNAPFTDSAYGWMADALLPLSPIFEAAPMVILRGNHEACDQGGNAFFLFFAPSLKTSQTCAPIMIADHPAAPPPQLTPTWIAQLKIRRNRTLKLALVDSAYGEDSRISSWAPIQRQAYQQASALMRDPKGAEVWLLVHRPIFGHVSTDLATTHLPIWTPWGSLDQTAASYGLLDPFELILSSHIHVMQATQIPGQPGQMILGNGGTYLDPETGYGIPKFGPLADSEGKAIAPGLNPYPSATMSFTAVTYGYAMAHPGSKKGEWRWDQLKSNGTLFARCTQIKRNLSCKAAKPLP